MNELYLLEVKEYKNYKELCKALNWNIKTGNSKIAQQRQLSSVCKWHKQGNKIVITEIYTEPREKIDNRGNKGHNTSKYMEAIDILKSIFTTKNEYIYTFNELCRLVGFTNNNFSVIEETKKISNYLGINIETIEDFLNDTKTRLRNTIETSLNNLQKQGCISWCYKYNMQDLNGKWHIATPEEEQQIKECIDFCIEDMGYKNKQDVYLHKKSKEMYKKVNKILENEYICKLCYRCYVINVNNIEQQNNINVNNLKNILNEKLINACVKSLNNRINKVKNNTWGIAEKFYDINKQTSTYKKDSEELINTFIKIGAKDITKNIEKAKESFISAKHTISIDFININYDI